VDGYWKIPMLGGCTLYTAELNGYLQPAKMNPSYTDFYVIFEKVTWSSDSLLEWTVPP